MTAHASPQRESPFLARHKERIARVDRAIARLRRSGRATSTAPRPEKRD
jgi:hypothetical protein